MAVALRNRYKDRSTHYVAEWTSISRLAQQTPAWRDLAARSIDPNPFYEPDYLLASVELTKKDIRAVAVYRDGSRDSELIGLFPLQRASVFDGAIIPALEFYRNDFICKTTPLIDREDPQGVWDSFIDRCAHSPDQPQKIIGNLMSLDSAAQTALMAALEARGLPSNVFGTYERAILGAPERFETAYRRIADKRRKDLARRRRKMRGEGVSINTNVSDAASKAKALDDFLRIEASGWKGKAGTAMACRPETKAFAERVFTAPNAEINILTFNAEPIAVECNLVSGGIIHTVKNAYVEEFAAYAPGLLIGLHNVRRMADSTQYKGIDSCAISGHVSGEIWPDRQRMGTIAFATSDQISQSSIDQMVTFIASTRRLKAWLSNALKRS